MIVINNMLCLDNKKFHSYFEPRTVLEAAVKKDRKRHIWKLSGLVILNCLVAKRWPTNSPKLDCISATTIAEIMVEISGITSTQTFAKAQPLPAFMMFHLQNIPSQNLDTCHNGRDLSLIKFASKSVLNFWSNPAHKQTNKVNRSHNPLGGGNECTYSHMWKNSQMGQRDS